MIINKLKYNNPLVIDDFFYIFYYYVIKVRNMYKIKKATPEDIMSISKIKRNRYPFITKYEDSGVRIYRYK